MKHLFFVAVASGIFSGTTISVKAQTNVNIERFAPKGLSKNSPKFIEGIEIQREHASDVILVPAEIPQFSPEAIITPGAAKPGFVTNIELCSSLQFKYALMMDTEVEQVTNASLYSFIDSWWATRYRYGGNDRSGIDCSAFTGKLLSEVYGTTVPRTARDQYKLCEKIAESELEEGDLVFFNTRGGVSHVGLYLGNNYFVHSSVNSGVTISSLKDGYYSRKFIAGGRIVETSAPVASIRQ